MTEEELKKHIGTHIQARRKAAGFKSARLFAEHVGIPVSAYTEYEQGRRNISFERAWEIADALACSLDDLGGRNFTPPGAQPAYEDPFQAELIECYEESTPDGKNVILGAARGQRELSKKVPERSVAGTEVPVAKAV